MQKKILIKPDKEITISHFIYFVWNKKWKIIFISLVSSLIFGIYANKQPVYYETLVDLRPGKNSQFIRYLFLSDIFSDPSQFQDNEISLNENPSTNMQILHNDKIFNNDQIFQEFINEFYDYEEVINILKELPFIQNKYNHLSYEDYVIQVSEIAKLFKIIYNKNKIEKYQFSLKWHDESESLKLIDNSIKAILKNLKIKYIHSMNEYIKAKELDKKLKLLVLEKRLESIKEIQMERLNQRIDFLKEQKLISQELEIENEATQNSLELNSSVYFLNGYKKIDDEIKLLQNIITKIPENPLQFDSDYSLVSFKVKEINNDLTSTKLANAIEILENHDYKNWITYNMNMAEVKVIQHSTIKYLIFGLIFGFGLGSCALILINSGRGVK